MADIGNDLTSLFNQVYPNGNTGNTGEGGNVPSSFGGGIGSNAPDVTAQGAVGPGTAGGQMSAAAPNSSADLQKYFEEVSGYNRWALQKQLAQQKATLDFQYKQLAAQTKNAQQRLNLDTWYQHAQVSLLQQTHDLDVQKQQDVEQQFAQTFGLQQKQFEAAQQQFGQQQGLDILKTQASLSGPQNFVQSANYAAGIAGNPAYAGFVNSLVNGQNSRLFGPAAAGPAPTPLTLGGLAGLTTGTGTTAQGAGGTDPTAAAALAGGNDLQQRLAQANSLVSSAQQLGQAGAGSLGAQSLERLSPTQQGLVQSGFGGAGLDFSQFVKDYQNSRVGNNGGAVAA